MSRSHSLALGGLLVLLTAASLPAEEKGGRGDRAIVLYGHGGGFSAFTDLNDAGTADFKTGWDTGGGVAPYFGLYAESTGWIYKWDRNEFDKNQFDNTWSGGISYRFHL